MEPYQSGELPPPRSEAADLGYETESSSLTSADKPVEQPVADRPPLFFAPTENPVTTVADAPDEEKAVAINVAPDAVTRAAVDEQRLINEIETISLGDLENDLYRS